MSTPVPVTTDPDFWRTRYELKAVEAAEADAAIEALTGRCFQLTELLESLGHPRRDLELLLTEGAQQAAIAEADAGTGRSLIAAIVGAVGHARDQQKAGQQPDRVLTSLLTRLTALTGAVDQNYARNRARSHQLVSRRRAALATTLATMAASTDDPLPTSPPVDEPSHP